MRRARCAVSLVEQLDQAVLESLFEQQPELLWLMITAGGQVAEEPGRAGASAAWGRAARALVSRPGLIDGCQGLHLANTSLVDAAVARGVVAAASLCAALRDVAPRGIELNLLDVLLTSALRAIDSRPVDVAELSRRIAVGDSVW